MPTTIPIAPPYTPNLLSKRANGFMDADTTKKMAAVIASSDTSIVTFVITCIRAVVLVALYWVWKQDVDMQLSIEKQQYEAATHANDQHNVNV